MQLKSIFLSAALVILTLSVQAGVITLSGMYQGKNLYVQNPFSGNMKDFCANEVFVNDNKVTVNVQSSAFEIDLTFLKPQDVVTVKIVHRDDCKPKILNPQVIRANSAFSFSAFHVEKEHIIFATKGEKPKGKLFIEQFVNNSWQTIKEVNGKESVILNNYDLQAAHHSGLNKYRIKYLESDGQVYYSNVVEFTSDLAELEVYPKRITDKIYLSRPAAFEVLDSYGNIVRKGNQKEINMEDQPSGVYYLNADNKTHKLFKK